MDDWSDPDIQLGIRYSIIIFTLGVIIGLGFGLLLRSIS